MADLDQDRLMKAIIANAVDSVGKPGDEDRIADALGLNAAQVALAVEITHDVAARNDWEYGN